MSVPIWTMTEAELLLAVVELCEQRGVAWIHIDTPHHNKGDDLRGFPDLLLVGLYGVAFRELKTMASRGRLRPAQTGWKYRLLSAGQDWAVWTPGDLESGRIARELDLLSAPVPKAAP